MTPPRGDPLKSNSISMYFPFREQRERERETWLLPFLVILSRRHLGHVPPSQDPTPSLPRPRRCSLTNREELSFLTVLAFPKASRMGLACSSCRSSSPWKGTQRRGEGQAVAWLPDLLCQAEGRRQSCVHTPHVPGMGASGLRPHWPWPGPHCHSKATFLPDVWKHCLT